MKKSNKMKVFSFAGFQAVLFALVGLVCGIVYSFGGLSYDVITTGTVNGGTALAFLALIGMPAIFALCGLTVGIIESLLYNLFAKWLDGNISLNFEQRTTA